MYILKMDENEKYEYDYLFKLCNNLDKINKAINQYNKNHNEYIDPIHNNNKDIRNLITKPTINLPLYLKSSNCKMTYINSGSTGHFFKIIHTSDDGKIYNFGMKLTTYDKLNFDNSVYDSNRPENVEIRILSILSKYVFKNETPHIILPLGTFYTNIEPFISISCNGESAKINDIKNRYQTFKTNAIQGKYANIVSINFYEYANNGDFLQYIKKNYATIKLIEWKVFMFQIISTLAIIQSHYPGFKHNDLKANNILVHKIKKSNNNISYKICNHLYTTPNIGYILKICDFDFSSIDSKKNKIINQKVETEWAHKNGINSTKNRYYDIHYLFNSLITKGFVPELLTSSNVPDEFKNFIYRIIPNHYRSKECCNSHGRLICNDEYMSPQGILEKDEFFKELRR